MQWQIFLLHIKLIEFKANICLMILSCNDKKYLVFYGSTDAWSSSQQVFCEQEYDYPIGNSTIGNSNIMQQSTHLDNFEGVIGDNLIRLNLITRNQTQPSLQGLGIYIENDKEGRVLEEIFTTQKLPKQAETIFFDFPTLFDYIIEHHRDHKRVNVIPDGLLVCNIIKARGVERRQEVILPLTIKSIKKPLASETMQGFSQINSKLAELTATTSELLKGREELKQEIYELRKLNYSQSELMKQWEQNTCELQEAFQIETQSLRDEINLLKATSLRQLAMLKEQHKYHQDIIQTLKQQLSLQKDQNSNLKQYLKSALSRNPQISEVIHPPFLHTHLLGQKVNLSIDTQNQFITMFKISANKLERVKADLTRYQLLGNQIMGKVSSSYYEVTINKLASGNLLIGLASLSRRGERHSHDHRECVCLQASGKLFEMGKKYPSILKLQAGQTVRVHLDLDSSRVRWLVGFTEVAAVLLPDFLIHSKLVPYIELNEVGDCITLNQ